MLVTRPRAQAARLAAYLEAYGAEAVAVPTIRLEPPDDWTPLDEALARLPGFAWVVLTSANGVAALRARLAHAGLDGRALAATRLAAIGPETAAALAEAGFPAALVPPEYRAEALVEALRDRVRPGEAVLLVRAAEARDVLPRGLADLGVRVTVAPAYRTVVAVEHAATLRGLLTARAVDAVVFTASSTVRGFTALLGGEGPGTWLRGVVVAAIGPVTAATARELGLTVHVVPTRYTVPALAAALAARFASGVPGPGV